MGFIAAILGTILSGIFSVVGNYGISIILLTILIRLLILPLSMTQIKSTSAMQEIQPKIQEIQKKYANNKEKQAQLTMELYKTHKINPLSGCLPILIQMPIMIGVFTILKEPAKYVFKEGAHEIISQSFLWMKSLALPDSIVIGGMALPFILPVAAAAATYFDARYMMASQPTPPSSGNGPDMASSMSKSMLYVGPIMILFSGATFPAGLTLYWAVSTFFSIAQRRVFDMVKKIKKEKAEEEKMSMHKRNKQETTKK